MCVWCESANAVYVVESANVVCVCVMRVQMLYVCGVRVQMLYVYVVCRWNSDGSRIHEDVHKRLV